MKFVNLHCHSSFSILDGLSEPSQVAERSAKLGYNAASLTDHGNMGGCCELEKACKKIGIKPIHGCEIYLSKESPTIKTKENRHLSHLCILAKNKDGFKQLLKLTAKSNNDENFYYRPRLQLNDLSEFANGNLISFSGHAGSELADILFSCPKSAYNAKTEEEVKQFIKADWVKETTDLACKYRDIFGKDNFFLEIQLIDEKNFPAAKIIAKGLRYISKQTKIPCVATADSHYPTKEDASLQRILLCTAMQTTLKEVQKKIDGAEDIGFAGFFRSNNYHIPSLEEIQLVHNGFESEIENSQLIADMCEDYTLGNKPLLPHFSCPNGLSADEYLKQLCRDGWEKVKNEPNIDEYTKRIKYELDVISGAGLSSYFLIVQDYVKQVWIRGGMTGPARGSAAGCLISYLIGITSIDPIRYGLYFERFFSAGRANSLPDIDTDMPVKLRREIIEYVREKYGKDNVAQMVTYGRIMGRGALKEVLRVHDVCSFDEMNKITELIPDEAKIADDLQEMKDESEDGESSIIMWSLQNNSNKLKDYCIVKENGEFEGKYATYFQQAIKLEGSKKSLGKHPSGLIIASEKMSDFVPMIHDKSSDELIIGVGMKDAESLGCPKFDFLGLNALDKIIGCVS